MKFFAAWSFAAGALALGLAGSAEARVGVTSVTSGEPLGKPPEQTERVLRVGIDVQASERVTTKADDRAHLVFLDGTSLTVGPNSSLVIDKFVFDPDQNKGEMAITTTRGVFRFVGGAISKTSEVQVKTPSATLGIRGGMMQWNVEESGHVVAKFLAGQSMSVTTPGGGNQLATRNGTQVDVPPGGRPGPLMIMPPGAMMGDRSFEKAPANQPGERQPQQATYREPQPQQQPANQQQPVQRQPAEAQQPTQQPADRQPAPTGDKQPTGPQITLPIERALDGSGLAKINSGEKPGALPIVPLGPKPEKNPDFRPTPGPPLPPKIASRQPTANLPPKPIKTVFKTK